MQQTKSISFHLILFFSEPDKWELISVAFSKWFYFKKNLKKTKQTSVKINMRTTATVKQNSKFETPPKIKESILKSFTGIHRAYRSCRIRWLFFVHVLLLAWLLTCFKCFKYRKDQLDILYNSTYKIYNNNVMVFGSIACHLLFWQVKNGIIAVKLFFFLSIILISNSFFFCCCCFVWFFFYLFFYLIHNN